MNRTTIRFILLSGLAAGSALLFSLVVQKSPRNLAGYDLPVEQVSVNAKPVEATEDRPLTSARTRVAALDQWEGSSMFPSVDPVLVDDSIVQQAMAGLDVNRYRIVEINADEIRRHMRDPETTKKMEFHLFKDLKILGMPYEATEYHDGPFAGHGSWRGSVDGQSGSPISVAIGPDKSTSIQISTVKGALSVTRLESAAFHLVLDFTHKPSEF